MKEIKAFIFDLDNTLYDAEVLTEETLKQAIAAMIAAGLKTSLQEGFKTIKEIIRIDPRKDKFRELTKFFGQEDEKIITAGHERYIEGDFDTLQIFQETKSVLASLKKKYKLALLSQGSPKQQEKKIEVLGIRPYFDFLFFPMHGQKKEFFEKAIMQLKVDPHEIFVVGDRIDNEIKIAKSLGMKTARLLHGKYASLKPKEKNEKADFEIKNLKEILKIVKTY